MKPNTVKGVNAFLAALKGRCPQCGKGHLFEGYLRLARQCSGCGADFSHADSGDGPAVFVMFAVGAVVVPLAFLLEFVAHWSAWSIVIVVAGVTILLSLALLQPFKAMLFAAQWIYHAGEGRRDDEP